MKATIVQRSTGFDGPSGHPVFTLRGDTQKTVVQTMMEQWVLILCYGAPICHPLDVSGMYILCVYTYTSGILTKNPAMVCRCIYHVWYSLISFWRCITTEDLAVCLARISISIVSTLSCCRLPLGKPTYWYGKSTTIHSFERTWSILDYSRTAILIHIMQSATGIQYWWSMYIYIISIYHISWLLLSSTFVAHRCSSLQVSDC